MTQKKLHFIGPGHGTETRNTINAIISILNDLGYTYNEALIQARDILEKAKEANDKNADVQRQLDDIILESGTSDAELVQARGAHNLLKDRLDHSEDHIHNVEKGVEAFDEAIKANQRNLNDAMAALERRRNPMAADIDTAQARSAFIDQMNEKAAQFGMTSTNFVNPHGLRNSNQRTTARDILLMGIKALAYPEITAAMTTRSKTLNIEGPNARTLEVTHTFPSLVYEDSYFSDGYNMAGGKTGTLSGASGRVENVMMSVSTKHSTTAMIGAVLNAQENRYNELRRLFDAGNSSMKSKKTVSGLPSETTNPHFSTGLTGWSVNAGEVSLDYDDYVTHSASLVVNSVDGGSSQVGISTRNFNMGDKYYVYTYVKCTRYVTGYIGIQFLRAEHRVALERTTNGWELVSDIIEVDRDSGRIFGGGIAGADLDGKIDSISAVNLTAVFGPGNEPSKAELDALQPIVNIDSIGSSMIVTKTPPNLAGFGKDNLPVLFEQKADDVTEPASLTKVMTAILVMEHYKDLDKTFEIKEGDLSSGSGSDYQPGDVLSLRDALHILMMESSNTMANALARVTGNKMIIEKE